jgi:hypothetical protein
MSERATPFHLAVLAGACLAVASPPALLLWHFLGPVPWDSRTLQTQFESVRYEAASLVFTYSVENRAWRSLRLTPDHTEIRLVQEPGQPPAGFPSFSMPLYFEGHSRRHIELRMQLPATPTALYRQQLSDENTRRVLEQAIPGLSPEQGALLPQPYPKPISPPQADLDLNRLIEDTLRTVDGFELIDPGRGVRLLFPRGW